MIATRREKFCRFAPLYFTKFPKDIWGQGFSRADSDRSRSPVPPWVPFSRNKDHQAQAQGHMTSDMDEKSTSCNRLLHISSSNLEFESQVWLWFKPDVTIWT
jgi:hypothetical protein